MIPTTTPETEILEGGRVRLPAKRNTGRRGAVRQKVESAMGVSVSGVATPTIVNAPPPEPPKGG